MCVRARQDLCKRGPIPIQTPTCMCYTFHNENFEAFINPAMYICGIHYSGNCVVRNGLSVLHAMTSTAC